MKINNVFISYSHDSEEHKNWVLKLANRLRRDGIDTEIDQFLSFGANIATLMNSIENYEKVLVICTKNFYKKFKSGKGGAAYEMNVATAEIMNNLNTEKFIPIIRQDRKEDNNYFIPAPLLNKKYENFSNDFEFEKNYKSLLMTLYGQDEVIKEPIGTSPFDLSDENVMKKETEVLNDIFNTSEKVNRQKSFDYLENTYLYSEIDFSIDLNLLESYSIFVHSLKCLVKKNSLIEESEQVSYSYNKAPYGHCLIIFYQKNNNPLAYNSVITLDEECNIKHITSTFNETTFRFKELDYTLIGIIEGANLTLNILKFNDKIKFKSSNNVTSRVYQSSEIKKIEKFLEKANDNLIINESIDSSLTLSTRVESSSEHYLIFQFYNEESNDPDKASIWINKKELNKFIMILNKDKSS